MPSADASAFQHSNLNRFLYADVGVEASGMTVSVLSILARRGLDPWQEAGRLNKLPRPAAIEGLARMITAIPASVWTPTDAAAIAARLVALLPGRTEAAPIPPRLVDRTVRAGLVGLRTNRRWLVVVLLAMLLAGLTVDLARQSGIPDIGHRTEAVDR